MTNTPYALRADATRARLQEAAIEAFAAKGFHGTTTRDVASAAGMSPAALYVHHKSKEELLYTISKEGHETTLQNIQSALATTKDPATGLDRVVRAFCLQHARGHTMARVVNYELAALSPEHLAEMRGIRRKIEDEIRGLIKRGIDNGQFAIDDPAMAAAALLSLGIDLARWYDEGVHWTPEQIAEHYAEMALRIVGAA